MLVIPVIVFWPGPSSWLAVISEEITIPGAGVFTIPVNVLWSRPSSLPVLAMEETAFVFSTSPPSSSSTFSLVLGCWERHKRRLSKRAVFVNILRRRRYILSRSSSDGTSGPSKSLATRRKPPRGKSVILRTLVSYSTLGSLGVEQTYKKEKDKHGDVCNRKLLVVHTVERSRGSDSQRNGRR
jgi:hypothetical protein